MQREREFIAHIFQKSWDTVTCVQRYVMFYLLYFMGNMYTFDFFAFIIPLKLGQD